MRSDIPAVQFLVRSIRLLILAAVLIVPAWFFLQARPQPVARHSNGMHEVVGFPLHLQRGASFK